MEVKWMVCSGPFEGVTYRSTDAEAHGAPFKSAEAHGVLERGDHIYVTGKEVHGILKKQVYYRIEKRRKADGALVRVQMLKELGTFYGSCTIVGDRLYVFGVRDILVLDLDLNPIVSIPRDMNLDSFIDLIDSTPFHDGFFYAASSKSKMTRSKGILIGDVQNWEWIIEKRRIADLALVKRHVMPIFSRVQFPGFFEIALNPVTKQLWVVGSTKISWDDPNRMIIEVFDLELNKVKTISKEMGSHVPLYFEFDEEGCAYILTFAPLYFREDREDKAKFDAAKFDARLLKHDKYGDVVSARRLDPYLQPSAIKYVNGYLYVVGNEHHEGPFSGHVLQVFDKNLDQVDELVLTSDTHLELRTVHRFPFHKMASDGRNLYVVGLLEKGELEWWYVYSISIVSPVPDVSQPRFPLIPTPPISPVAFQTVIRGVPASSEVEDVIVRTGEIRCSNCGFLNSPSFRVCKNCGKQLIT
jgi:hypothetical protein